MSKVAQAKPVKEPDKAQIREVAEKKTREKDALDPFIRLVLGMVMLAVAMYILAVFIGRRSAVEVAREEPQPIRVTLEQGDVASRDIDVSGCRSFKIAASFDVIENVERIEVHGFTQRYSTLLSLFSKPMPGIKYEVDSVANFYIKASVVFIPVQGNTMKVDGNINIVCVH